MKKLLVLRHAKSSWDDNALDDHDRPLNKRGEKEAPRIGQHLRELDLIPSAIISSTARRARETARLVAAACRFEAHAITHEPRLYHGSPAQILEVIHTFPDEWEQPLIVGHNPELEELLSGLAGEDVEMKTAALAVLDFEIARWRDVRKGKLATIVRGREL